MSNPIDYVVGIAKDILRDAKSGKVRSILAITVNDDDTGMMGYFIDQKEHVVKVVSSMDRFFAVLRNNPDGGDTGDDSKIIEFRKK